MGWAEGLSSHCPSSSLPPQSSLGLPVTYICTFSPSQMVSIMFKNIFPTLAFPDRTSLLSSLIMWFLSFPLLETKPFISLFLCLWKAMTIVLTHHLLSEYGQTTCCPLLAFWVRAMAWDYVGWDEGGRRSISIQGSTQFADAINWRKLSLWALCIYGVEG